MRHSKVGRRISSIVNYGLLCFVFLCSAPSWAWDINYHQGLGNAVGVMVVQDASTGANLKVELYVLTAYPVSWSARVLAYDCLESRDPLVTAACLAINPGTLAPAVLDGCSQIAQLNSLTTTEVIVAWQCTQGVGKCLDTWSENGDQNGIGSLFPEIQVMTALSSGCTPK